MSRETNETPPIEDTPPITGKPSSSAAGATAIISTIKHGITRSGVTGSISLYFRKLTNLVDSIALVVHGRIQMITEQ